MTTIDNTKSTDNENKSGIIQCKSRVCITCNLEFVEPNKNIRSSNCRTCLNNIRRARNRAKKPEMGLQKELADENKKKCRLCGIIKSFEEFRNNRLQCKNCLNGIRSLQLSDDRTIKNDINMMNDGTTQLMQSSNIPYDNNLVVGADHHTVNSNLIQHNVIIDTTYEFASRRKREGLKTMPMSVPMVPSTLNSKPIPSGSKFSETAQQNISNITENIEGVNIENTPKIVNIHHDSLENMNIEYEEYINILKSVKKLYNLSCKLDVNLVDLSCIIRELPVVFSKYFKPYIPVIHKKNMPKILKGRPKMSEHKFKIIKAVRTRIKRVVTQKTKHTFEYIGCSYDLLVKWLQFNFDELMTLQNRGTYWHIDHVIPLSLFDVNKPENHVCFHWTNLTPLSAKDNLSKGNRININQVSNHYKKLQEFMKYENIQIEQQYLDLFARHLNNRGVP